MATQASPNASLRSQPLAFLIRPCRPNVPLSLSISLALQLDWEGFFLLQAARPEWPSQLKVANVPNTVPSVNRARRWRDAAF